MCREINSFQIVRLDYWYDFTKELVILSTFRLASKILDVGTGGWACLVAVAEILGENCQLVGIDYKVHRW